MTKLEQAARQALGALEVATTPLAKDRQVVLRTITTLREALSGVQALSAAPADALDEAMRERDDAEDFIDALLDEVLGHERPDWSNLYGRADALNDVQERMAALHKPAVDKAWGQFQSAMTAPVEQNTVPAEWLEHAYREGWAACRDAETIGEEAEDWAFGNSTANSRMIDAQQAAPQQEAQEPYAYAVYFPDQPKVELVHELDDLIDDLTNRPHVVTKLYTAPQPAPAPLSDDVVRDAALWHWLAEYLVGTRTDLDDEIVASKTVNDLRKLVEGQLTMR